MGQGGSETPQVRAAAPSTREGLHGMGRRAGADSAPPLALLNSFSANVPAGGND